MAYHAEHHAFPGVPFHRLGRLHEALKGDLEQLERGYVRTHARLIRSALAHRAVD
jgi:fatty acid desaturase